MFFLSLIPSISSFIDPPNINDEFAKINNILKENTPKPQDEESSLIEHDSISASSDDFYSEINSYQPKDKKEEKLKEELGTDKMLAEENRKKMDLLTEQLAKALNLKDYELAKLTDKKKWRNLFKHFEHNWKDYLVNGKLAIQFHMRYFLCCYIVVFIPAEFAFAYPAAWSSLIPKDKIKNEFILEALNGFRTFQEFIKKKSKEEFLVTVYFGRANGVIDDLLMLMKIPKMLFEDIGGLIRELLNFEFRSDGFEEFKKTKKRSWW